MAMWFNKSKNLTKEEILYAMENTTCNKHAAEFLGCHFTTYKRYAQLYYDEETNQTLWEKHRNPGYGSGPAKKKKPWRKVRVGHLSLEKKNVNLHHKFTPYSIFDIIEGKHPQVNKNRLAQMLLDEGLKQPFCELCGFNADNSRRQGDYRMPLVLHWKDNNIKNHAIENLEYVCYNCYFINYDEFRRHTNTINNWKGLH